MFSAIFGKKKYTDDQLANIFVNTLLNSVDEGFPHVAELVMNDPEFARRPNIDPDDSDRFLLTIITGNFNYLGKYFSATEEAILKRKIIFKFANVYGCSFEEFQGYIKEYDDFLYRVNHPSKNVLYGMSKTFFYKYNLAQYQDDYFREMNAPNPILLKRMDDIMRNYVWNWDAYLSKIKLAVPVAQ